MKYIKEYKDLLWSEIDYREYYNKVTQTPEIGFSENEIQQIGKIFKIYFYSNLYQIDVESGDILYTLSKRDDEWYFIRCSHSDGISYLKCDGFDAMLNYFTYIK